MNFVQFRALIREQIRKVLYESTFSRIELITATYTEQRHKFYGMYVKLDTGKTEKFSDITDADEFLQDIFHTKTKLPMKYDEAILAKIQSEVRKGTTMKVPFEYNDLMDVS